MSMTQKTIKTSMTQKVTGISFDKSITPPQRNSRDGLLDKTLDVEERKGGNLSTKNGGSMFFMCGSRCLFCEHIHGEITGTLEFGFDVA